MKEIEIPLHRRRSQQKQDVTEEERTELRGRLGELQWLQNTRPDVCASCSIMQGGVNKAQVKELIQVNNLIRGSNQDADMEIVFRKIDLDDMLVVSFCDAAWGVRMMDHLKEATSHWQSTRRRPKQDNVFHFPYLIMDPKS